MFRPMILILAFVSMVAAARADIAIPAAHSGRFALADAIFVGRVVTIEPEDIAIAAPGGGKATYRIAVVQVIENILGKAETKTVRVGFVPIAEAEPVRRRYPLFNFKLASGDHGLLILRRHPAEKIFVGNSHFDFVPYEDDKGPAPPVERWGRGAFASELKQARRVAAIVDNPLAALRAKEQPDRFVAACQLLYRYRTPIGPDARTERISEEESKLIFAALLEQDWKLVLQPPSAWDSFQMLGLTEKQGWKAPVQISDANDLRRAAQAWHRDHGQDYRIERYLRAAK